MSPARAGAFNANFAPDTLEAFRKHCKDNNKQYTKVLERLAEIYLQTDGSILSVPGATGLSASLLGADGSSDLHDLLRRIQKIEKENANAYSHLEAVIEDLASRVDALEK